MVNFQYFLQYYLQTRSSLFIIAIHLIFMFFFDASTE